MEGRRSLGYRRFRPSGGISSATAATLPTGFEERTVVSGLTAPTAVAWAPDGRMFVAEKGGKVRVVTAARRAGLDAAGRHLRPREHGRRPRPARASRSTRLRHEPLPVPALHLRRQDRRAPDQPKSSRLTRVTVNANNTALGRDGAARQHPHAAVPGAVQHRGLHPVRQRLALDRDRPLGARRHAVGRLGRRRRTTAASTRSALRTHDEQSFGGKIIHIDRNGNGLPGHPFCPATRTSRRSAPRSTQRASATRSASRSGRTACPPSATWAGARGRRSTSRSPGRNYGWPCYEGKSRPGGYSSMADLQGPLRRRRARRAGVTFPTSSTRTARARRSSAARPTRAAPYPDEFDGDIFFGDYVQGFIKRLELDAAGKVTGTKDFATDWYGVDIELWNGELYYVDFGDGAGLGPVVRIAYSPNNRTPDRGRDRDADLRPRAAEGHLQGRRLERPGRRHAHVRVGLRRRHGEEHRQGPPVHTYTKGGNFDARLKVTDSGTRAPRRPCGSRSNNTPPVRRR